MILQHLKYETHKQKFKTRKLLEMAQAARAAQQQAPALPAATAAIADIAAIACEGSGEGSGGPGSGGNGSGGGDMAVVAFVSPQSQSICGGLDFDLIGNTRLGQMRQYLTIWLGTGKIAWKHGASQSILFTVTGWNKLHLQSALCFKHKCFFVVAGPLPCCPHCCKVFKDWKVCEDIAGNTYLLMKSKILEAMAG